MWHFGFWGSNDLLISIEISTAVEYDLHPILHWFMLPHNGVVGNNAFHGFLFIFFFMEPFEYLPQESFREDWWF